MTTKTTRWRFVRGFERRYLIRDDGLVWSIKAMKPMSQAEHPRHGYLTVMLWDGRRYCRTVHSLVAEAFIGPRPDGHVTRHLNTDSRDNRASNLAYGTPSDNNRDTYRHGKRNGNPPQHRNCLEGYCAACDNDRRADRYRRSSKSMKTARQLVTA